jgi:hypothetical protein
MSPKLANRVLLVLSIIYGTGIAILAVLNSSAVATVAVVGALILGALWAIRGVVVSCNRPS